MACSSCCSNGAFAAYLPFESKPPSAGAPYQPQPQHAPAEWRAFHRPVYIGLLPPAWLHPSQLVTLCYIPPVFIPVSPRSVIARLIKERDEARAELSTARERILSEAAAKRDTEAAPADEAPAAKRPRVPEIPQARVRGRLGCRTHADAAAVAVDVFLCV